MRFYLSIISSLLLGAASLSAQTSAPTIDTVPQSLQVSASVAQSPVSPHTEQAHIEINRFVLATGVSNHEPENIKENFSVQDGKVFAFVELSSYGHTHVTFQWKHKGKPHFEFKASVKDTKRWRTFSSVKALAGEWSVAVQDEQGNVLKEISFNVSNDAMQNASAPQASKEGSSIKEVLSSLEPNKPENLSVSK